MKEKKIEDYLHLYLGCRCQTPEGETGLRGVFEDCEPIFSTISGSFPHEEVYPILRPLSSITKEEVADLMGIEGFITRGDFSHPTFQLTWTDLNNQERFRHQHISQLTPHQFLFLLLEHFDLFGLIEAGLAIDETKQPEPYELD